MIDKFMLAVDNKAKPLLPELKPIQIGFETLIADIQTQNTEILPCFIHYFLSDGNNPLLLL